MENRAKPTASQEAPRRFLFDQSFDVAPKPKKPKPEEEKPPEPTFSRDELEAARQDGYAHGHAAGSKEAAAAVEADIARLVAVIGERLPVLSEDQAAANQRLLQDGARLATTIARKILPAFSARHGMEEIAALVSQCLQTLIDQPKITVRVAPPNIEAVRAHLDTAASASAFDGRFLVEPETTMGPSDCRILWQGGGLERREADIWRQVDAATENYLGGLPKNTGGDTPAGEDPTQDAAATQDSPEGLEPERAQARNAEQATATDISAGTPAPTEDQ